MKYGDEEITTPNKIPSSSMTIPKSLFQSSDPSDTKIYMQLKFKKDHTIKKLITTEYNLINHLSFSKLY